MDLHLNYHYITSQNPNNVGNNTQNMNKSGFLANSNLLFERPKRKGSPEKKERKNALTLSPYEMLKLIAKTKEKEEIVREINNKSKEKANFDPILDIKSITTKEEAINEINNKSRERRNTYTILDIKAISKENQALADSNTPMLNIIDNKDESHFIRNFHSRNVSSETSNKMPISRLSLRPSLHAIELDKSVISSPQYKKIEEKLVTPEKNLYQSLHFNDASDRSLSLMNELNKEIALPSINKQFRSESRDYYIFLILTFFSS